MFPNSVRLIISLLVIGLSVTCFPVLARPGPQTPIQRNESYSVSCLVYSGTKNPTFTLLPVEVEQLFEVVTSLPAAYWVNASELYKESPVMGYAGFHIRAGESQESLWLNDGNVVEKLLVASLIKRAKSNSRSQTVVEHVTERLYDKRGSTSEHFECDTPGVRKGHMLCCSALGCPLDIVQGIIHEEKEHNFDCDVSKPLVGPDTVPKYAPHYDNHGCFVDEQTNNNCYNYGNDIVTNTFAQPGRGSGKEWTANTCDDMKVAAERDGLVWYGTDLPQKDPDDGHYVALFIWPKTNFHWARRDTNGYWSHKPGQTPIRDVDNNGNRITDPSHADLSPWTQFCGYYVTVPSKVTIR